MKESLFIEKITYNCNKKIDLIEKSIARYALRSIFAGAALLFLPVLQKYL